LLEQFAEQLESAIRVDPSSAGFGQSEWFIGAETGGVGQQVTHRRPGRAGGVVELYRAFLAGHPDRGSDERLGHRGEGETVVQVPARGEDAFRAHRGDRDMVRRPPRDQLDGSDRRRRICRGCSQAEAGIGGLHRCIVGPRFGCDFDQPVR